MILRKGAYKKKEAYIKYFHKTDYNLLNKQKISANWTFQRL